MIARLLPLLLIAAAPLQQDSWDSAIKEWNKPGDPVRITDNVWYVGTGGLSAYLITGNAGHVLIDGGLPQSAPIIAENVRKAGFKLADVKVLLINHAHFDHSGGLAELKKLTGARLLASAGDKPDLEKGMTNGRSDLLPYPAVKVDAVIADGEHIRLGNIDLTTLATPGHTKGCTSWTLPTTIAGAPKDMLFVCSISVAGQDLKGGANYPNAVADFRATFARLKTVKADIFVNFHPEAFDLATKKAKLEAGDRAAFVDPGEAKRRVEASEAAFEKELKAAQ